MSSGSAAAAVVLRLNRATPLLTASVFEELFVREIGRAVTVRQAPCDAWWSEVLGPPGREPALDVAASRLAPLLAGVDFVSPNFEAAALAPLFLWLRTRARLRTRLLLVAHSPGACAVEWALLARLLGPGDLIVAPSRNARAVIEALCPAVAPFVRVIPHPMTPLPATTAARGERLVSLGRIHPAKLLHRQIEALALLRARGAGVPQLQIGGDASQGGAAVYARSLVAQARRLGLDAQVELVGALRGAEAKARFLGGARVLLNLSVTIEESFGKAPVEALGLGVPVLATHWDGLPEAVGTCGETLRVACDRPGQPADVAPEAIADALERLLARPPAAQACREQARGFAPDHIVPRYAAALDEARATALRAGASDPEPQPEDRAAPDEGLLSAVAPLTCLSWRELFDGYVQSCVSTRRTWAGAPGEGGPGDHLRVLLLNGTRWPIERLLSGLPVEWPRPPAVRAPVTPDGADWLERLAASAVAPGIASSRLACLAALAAAGRLDALRHGLDELEREGVSAPGVDVLRAEEALLAGDPAQAFERGCRGLELASDGEVSAHRLRQLARIARAWGQPERALPWLGAWLERFPDAPESGLVWLERGLNAARSGADEHEGEAARSLERARTLLGELPALTRLTAWVQARALARAAQAGP